MGTHFARAILVRAGAGETKRIARLGAVVTGLNDAAQVEYTFACGAYTLEIPSRPRGKGRRRYQGGSGRFLVKATVDSSPVSRLTIAFRRRRNDTTRAPDSAPQAGWGVVVATDRVGSRRDV